MHIQKSESAGTLLALTRNIGVLLLWLRLLGHHSSEPMASEVIVQPLFKHITYV